MRPWYQGQPLADGDRGSGLRSAPTGRKSGICRSVGLLLEDEFDIARTWKVIWNSAYRTMSALVSASQSQARVLEFASQDTPTDVHLQVVPFFPLLSYKLMFFEVAFLTS